jgi:hypothetical protein
VVERLVPPVQMLPVPSLWTDAGEDPQPQPQRLKGEAVPESFGADTAATSSPSPPLIVPTAHCAHRFEAQSERSRTMSAPVQPPPSPDTTAAQSHSGRAAKLAAEAATRGGEPLAVQPSPPRQTQRKCVLPYISTHGCTWMC